MDEAGYDIQDDDVELDGGGWLSYTKQAEGGEELEVQIYSLTRNPLLWQLTMHPSTSTVGFITWNRAYCLFPRNTFIEKEGFLLQNLDCEDWGEEYRATLCDLSKVGINTKGLPLSEKQDVQVTMHRRIGDKYTWMIDLDTSLLPQGCLDHVPNAVIEATTFRVRPCEDVGNIGPIPRYEMANLTSFEHPILRHLYLVLEDKTKAGDSKTEYGYQITKLKQQFDNLTRLEILKLSDDERPNDYRQFVDRGGVQDKHPSTFTWGQLTVPECWTYFDDDLLKELNRLWEQYGGAKLKY
jgi:hypothetical protein